MYMYRMPEKNSMGIIMDNKQLRSLRQKLKTVTDTLNYQKFLYKAERKQAVKQTIQQKFDKYQKLKGDIQTTISEHTKHKYNITINIYELFNQDRADARKRKTDKRRKRREDYFEHNERPLRLLQESTISNHCK